MGGAAAFRGHRQCCTDFQIRDADVLTVTFSTIFIF
jgi:hypothetical protein